MPRKSPEPHTRANAFTATDLARAAAKTGAAQDLAKQLAGFNAPIDALKKAIPVLPATNQIIQAHQTAADLAKALSGYSALSNLAKNLANPMPKVTLNLPDMSRTIQASLPRLVPDLPLRDEGAAVAGGPRMAPRANPPTSELPSIEVNSPEDLGQLLRKARERRNQSQQSFADLAGVGRRFVSELENGKATLELGKVLKVLHAAGLSIFARNPP